VKENILFFASSSHINIYVYVRGGIQGEKEKRREFDTVMYSSRYRKIYIMSEGGDQK
jgi:hypothetical protein